MSLRRCFAVLLGFTAITPPARGATPEDEAGAERLFQEAKTLMAEGRVHDACSRLEEAKRLEVGGGIVLALGVCHEKEGRGASALADFREALALAIDAKRADRVRLAETRAARLRESVSTLTLIVPPGIGVRVNGEPWEGARVGVAVPVDAGDYVVHAEAPGKQAWEQTLHLAAEGDGRRLEVPPLVDLVAPPQSAASSAPPGPETRAPTPGPDGEDGRRRRRVAGLAVGGVGVVGLGVGAAFAVLALTKRSEADCGGHLCAGATETYARAQSAADVASVATIAGGIALGAGALLFFTARVPPDASSRTISLQLAPSIAANGGWIGVAGRF